MEALTGHRFLLQEIKTIQSNPVWMLSDILENELSGFFKRINLSTKPHEEFTRHAGLYTSQTNLEKEGFLQVQHKRDRGALKVRSHHRTEARCAGLGEWGAPGNCTLTLSSLPFPQPPVPVQRSLDLPRAGTCTSCLRRGDTTAHTLGMRCLEKQVNILKFKVIFSYRLQKCK